ncbi:sigma-70 family RNA polymerase sigma factor [Paenibacillus albiflavus]|nr:RNA polymerase sigma factor [Paenibacillus albiflavus]
MSLYASDQDKFKNSLQQAFKSSIEPLQTALQWYCRSVTGSHFDAEDLKQETLLKAYAMFVRNPYKQEISKAYLFRIASNAWIDKCRKDKLLIDSSHDPIEVSNEQNTDALELLFAMETLISHLPPRQRVILLLIDSLRYTATEVAELLYTSEGAVKAALNRARTKLQQVNETAELSEPVELHAPKIVDDKIIYAYLAAFQANDPQALIMLLNDGAALDLVPAVSARTHHSPSDEHQTTHIYMNYHHELYLHSHWAA